MNTDDLKAFRKRMVGVILATDMAKHMEDLDTVKRRIEQLGITREAKNGDKFVNRETKQQLFDSQQHLLEISLHAADVSPPTRDFEITHEWTYLLFDEFFKQGDAEKAQNLPVSFLCDRETTNVAGSQPGFLSFIVVPLFKSLGEIMPELDALRESAERNTDKWKAYKETEEDKQVYKKREAGAAGAINLSKVAEPASDSGSECNGAESD